MKPFERLTRRAHFRTRTIVLGALMCLALASTSAGRITPPVAAALPVDVPSAAAIAETDDTTIRPFRVNVPDAALADLRNRVLATRWPEKETVNDDPRASSWPSFKSSFATGARTTTGGTWRRSLMRCLSSSTTIDGLDIHFIHVRSRHPTFPCQSSSRTVGPDPSWSSSRSLDRSRIPLHTVDERRMPSMWSYPRCPVTVSPVSRQPWAESDRIAGAWAELMRRVGYTRYVAQGGDWGSPISSAMARQAPPGLLGIHINLPGRYPPMPPGARGRWAAAGPGLSEKERTAFNSLDAFYKRRRAYGAMMGTRPQAIGQALSDSPAGLAVFMYDYNDGEPERLLTRDHFLDNVTLYG